jgi:hypothetical protein
MPVPVELVTFLPIQLMEKILVTPTNSELLLKNFTRVPTLIASPTTSMSVAF